MYANDVASCFRVIHYQQYADDIQFYVSSTIENLYQSIQSVNESLVGVSAWAQANFLQLNPRKTQTIIFSPSALDTASPPHIVLDDCQLLYCDTVKNLGVNFDSQMTWSNQVNATCKKVYGSLYSLRRLSIYTPEEMKVYLVKALVIPLFTYGSVLYVNCINSTCGRKLELAFNNCTQYAFKLKPRGHISSHRIWKIETQVLSTDDVGWRILWKKEGGSILPDYYSKEVEELDISTTALYDANSTSGEQINHFYFYVTEQLVVLWILFLFIVLGNSAVLLALSFSKNRKSRMNYFIMQLAIADLAVGLISVSTDIVWKITVEWHAGNFACKLIRYSQAVVTYSSTYVLVALSIDRYDAIKHPMRFSGSWRRARILVAVAWVLSALFSLPIFFLYEEKLVQNQLQCWIELGEQWEWQLYMTSVSTALFFIPALIITACYAVIVSTIWSKGSTAIVVKRTTKGFHDKVRLDNEDSRRASSRGLIPRAKVKTIKMTFVIVFVFIICWSPYILFDLLQVYGYVPRTQTNAAIATFVQSLAPLNSAANPLIYCLFSTRICRSLKKFAPFSWICSKCCPSVMTEHSRYAGDFSSTMTTSVTHSRRSPALTSSFHASRRRGTLL